MKRIEALDAIRFICAFIVFLQHFTLPTWIENPSITSIYNIIVNGTAAVCVFFVISGYCIHTMEKNNKSTFKDFIIARSLRLLPPLLPALALASYLDVSYHPVTGWITWSLVCEFAYYIIYPSLSKLTNTFDWKKITIISFALSIAAMLFWPKSGSIWDIAPVIIAGLPCWLLGVLLADEPPQKTPTSFRLAGWRATTVLAAIIYKATIKSGVDAMLIAPYFSIIVFYWIRAETNTPNTNIKNYISKAGKWSYSLYLFHVLAIQMVARIPHVHVIITGIYAWVFDLLFVIFICWILSRVFETPSHHASRWWGRRNQYLRQQAAKADISGTV